ncbi:hypothetical protein SADUNF_Sadunf04G0008300 [Salix dunnii]|uniref:Uncharacterized protein n=1 Tax=Salix dunnii TaxID=1413687 RepID=A0A835K369_9ROSI|nr:hypothetical protein SADUNF_Sadunf04G0008300 [Salix dunnii]
MADSGQTSNYTNQDTKGHFSFPFLFLGSPSYYSMVLFSDMDCFVSDAKSSANQDSNLQDFSEDEVSLIARMFRLVGKRWSLIAGRIPGRTAEEIENYWTSKNRSSKQR